MAPPQGGNMPWSQWEDLGRTSAAAVASWGHKRLDCFCRGPDGQLWHKWFDGGWKNWENLGQPMIGPLTFHPAAVSWSNKRIDIFARGQDSHLWHKYFDGGWSN